MGLFEEHCAHQEIGFCRSCHWSGALEGNNALRENTALRARVAALEAERATYRATVLEEAAKVCEEARDSQDTIVGYRQTELKKRIAARIRALARNGGDHGE